MLLLLLKKILDKELKKLKLSSLFYDVEQPLMRVLCEIENNGVKIDVGFLSSMSNQLTKLIEETEQKIFSIAGETFNIASPKQLGVILFDKLKIDEILSLYIFQNKINHVFFEKNHLE